MLSLPSFIVSSRRHVLLAWTALAALPLAYIALQVIPASRNIVFWDEFDTALDLILRLDAGAGWREMLQRFFAINNEHRMLTSRLMFAGSYWMTGTVNFHVIGAIGNLFLVGAGVLLIFAVREWERRVRLGVVFAFLMFQLEHFENFLWSGASIDHFQVVALAVATFVALGSGSRLGRAAAAGLGFLATFTLAHGCLVWPLGALFLWQQRRWNSLTGWVVASLAAVGVFFYGFEFNTGHRIGELSLVHVAHIGRYWLALVGAPLTFGEPLFAPLPGVVLLGAFALLLARGAARREPVAVLTGLFALGSLGLVALGRSEIAGALINSRYMVLGALAWAMVVFLVLEQVTAPARPFRWLAWLLPALVAFNVTANARFAPMVESFIEVRDRAATRFKQYGEDGRGIARLHPNPGHADKLLTQAEKRGVYRLPRVSHLATFPHAQPSTRIVTHVDELIANTRAVTVGGWAMIPGMVSKRGQVYLVLKSEKSLLIFSSATLQRPDVAKAYKEPRWRLCGFRAVIGRERLPAENFQIGVLIARGDEAEFMMTDRRLELAEADPAIIARLAKAD